MTKPIHITVNHVEPNYAWGLCGRTTARTFVAEDVAERFAISIGGTRDGLTVTKSCGNTVKFAPQSAFHSVCPACGSVWQLQGDAAYLDDDMPLSRLAER